MENTPAYVTDYQGLIIQRSGFVCTKTEFQTFPGRILIADER